MKKIRQIFLAILIILVAQVSVIAQESLDNQRISLNGISASIIPPKHFEYDSISGKISHTGSLSAIQATEVKNRNFKQITFAITKEYILSQGLELLDKQETKRHDGSDAIIYRCRFKSHDDKGEELNFIRLMLFTGNESTIWITADFPECIEKQIEEPITNSIKTITTY